MTHSLTHSLTHSHYLTPTASLSLPLPHSHCLTLTHQRGLWAVGCGLWAVGCGWAVREPFRVAVMTLWRWRWLRRCDAACMQWVFGFLGFWFFSFFGFWGFGFWGFGFLVLGAWPLAFWDSGVSFWGVQYLESVRVELIAEIWKYCTVLYHLKVE